MPERKMPEEDLELKKRAEVDAQAFGRLYERNYKRIFIYILHSTGDIETSLDLTSETFFKALRALPEYEHRGRPFSSWLYKIASREIAMYYRKSERSKTSISSSFSFPEEVERVRLATVEEEVYAAQKQLESCENFMTLSPLLRRLPIKYRVVVFLRFFEDRSIDEISGLLGRPVGTVKSQLHRALKKLRRDLQPDNGAGHLYLRGLETSNITYEYGEEVE